MGYPESITIVCDLCEAKGEARLGREGQYLSPPGWNSQYCPACQVASEAIEHLVGLLSAIYKHEEMHLKEVQIQETLDVHRNTFMLAVSRAAKKVLGMEVQDAAD